MAGSMEEVLVGNPLNRLLKYHLHWVSDGSGAVDVTTSYISGILRRVSFAPGDPAPDADYDVTLLDSAGYDVLNGQGADRSATEAETIAPGVETIVDAVSSAAPVALADELNLVIAGAGAEKEGDIYLYVEP